MNFLKEANRRGWWYTGGIIFNRLIPVWLFRCRRFLIYRLEIPSSFVPSSTVDVGWCETEDQFRSVETLTYFKRGASKTGPVCAAQATVENEIHCGIWMAVEYVEESDLGVRILLESKQAWLFAAMVSKTIRGRGVYSNVIRFVTSELGRQGFRDLLVSVNPDNRPSNHVHKKNANSCVGRVVTIRCLNWAWCFSSKTINRKSSFTTNAKNRPIELAIPPNPLG